MSRLGTRSAHQSQTGNEPSARSRSDRSTGSPARSPAPLRQKEETNGVESRADAERKREVWTKLVRVNTVVKWNDQLRKDHVGLVDVLVHDGYAIVPGVL